MNFRWIRKLSLWPFLSILIGFIAFFSITGGKILWPTYTAWIMDGDPAQSLVGWQFFRYSPTLQWPIGVNPNYGMNIGSSIVFTDSLPLLAFFFKPLSTLLPETFQYLGLWILICFSLQSFFAWKLLSLFTQDKWLPLIGSIFFTLAPVYLSRLTVVSCHYALFGQWVLLAALHYYFTKDLSIFRWIGLLAATVLIHAYLFAMVFVIWSADLIQRCWLKQTNISKTLNYFVAGSLTIAIIMWATGYFMLGKDIADSGFGHTRMNLLSLINPEEIWSKLLPAQKGGSGDYEGFNYLGLGMLGLCLVAVYVFLRNVKISHKVKIIPIFIISVGFFLFAISNKVAIGTHELFSYNLPLIAKPFAYTFRASGRFFWPVTYLIYLTTFYLLFTRLKRNAIIMLCVVMLCLQIIDSANAWRTLRKDIYRSSAWVSPMQSPAWSDIAHRYRQIIFVPPSNMPANWMPLAHFAATHRMAINIGYFTRVKRDKMREERARIINSIVNNQLSPDSLYVFENDAFWKFASSQIASSDITGVLDGFRIIAPNLRECTTCNMNAIASITDEGSYDLGYKMERISFTSNGRGQKYQLYGWSRPEDWGTWSDGDTSVVLLYLATMPKNDLELLLHGYAFITDRHPSQEVDILVNGHHVATLKYDQQDNSGMRVVKIPKQLALGKNGYLLIKFNFRNAISPSELGLSDSPRRYGLGIVSLQLQATDKLATFAK